MTHARSDRSSVGAEACGPDRIGSAKVSLDVDAIRTSLVSGLTHRLNWRTRPDSRLRIPVAGRARALTRPHSRLARPPPSPGATLHGREASDRRYGPPGLVGHRMSLSRSQASRSVGRPQVAHGGRPSHTPPAPISLDPADRFTSCEGPDVRTRIVTVRYHGLHPAPPDLHPIMGINLVDEW